MSSAGRKIVLPQHLESERLILGGILLGSPFATIAELLEAQDFTTQAHKTIWRRMAEIAAAGETIDRVLLAQTLMQYDELDTVGGLSYLVDLDTGMPQMPNLQGYARIVKEKSHLRRIIHAAKLSASQAMEAQDPAAEISAALIRNINEITIGIGAQSNLSAHQIITNDPGLNALLVPEIGVATGFSAIDHLIYGLRAGRLYIIGADTTTGKSSLALNIAHNLVREGIGVIYYTLEMGKEELMQRLLAAKAHVSLDRINRHQTTLIDRIGLTKAAELIDAYPLYIDDKSSLSVVEFYRKTSQQIRRAIGNPPIGVAIVDYLQIMDWQSGGQGMPKFTKEYEAIAYETRAFKEYARTLQIPVIVVSQLNRSRTMRSAKDLRPKLRDLHGGSSIEKDADVVMLLYREELDRPSEPSLKGQSEVIIAKNRGGMQGTVYLKFRGEYCEFSEPGFEPAYEEGAVA